MSIANQSVKQARRIRPRNVAKLAERKFTLLVIGDGVADRDELVAFFVPVELAAPERDYALACLDAVDAADPRIADFARAADVVVVTPRARNLPMALPVEADLLDPQAPNAGVATLLRRHANLLLALSRRFPRLRAAAAAVLIQNAAMRNAAIAALSAMPEVVPTPLGLVWAAGEFASDTVLLTSNQIRLALQLAAIQGESVGWLNQSGDILLILGGAFGWRALARTLVSLVPAGVGLAAKSSIAYGGTVAVGRFLWRRAEPRPWLVPRPAPRVVLERSGRGRWRARPLPNLAQRTASM
ncbi:MAG: hypothetical protein ACRD2H_03530 [Terriglobales bacterium]